MNVDWQRQFGVHSLYSMLLYTYTYDNANGINNTFYRQNAGWYTPVSYTHLDVYKRQGIWNWH